MPEKIIEEILRKLLSNAPTMVSIVMLAGWVLKRYVINGTIDKYFAAERRKERILRKILRHLDVGGKNNNGQATTNDDPGTQDS